MSGRQLAIDINGRSTLYDIRNDSRESVDSMPLCRNPHLISKDWQGFGNFRLSRSQINWQDSVTSATPDSYAYLKLGPRSGK
jgi:hypothetical protein